MAKREKVKGRPAAVKAAALPGAVPVKVTIELGTDTPIFYVNYAEVNFTPNDFSITAVRIPARVTPDQIANDMLKVAADVQLVVPLGVVPGLIRALTKSKEAYEKVVMPIKEPGDING